jgi:hypothetical protein
MAVRVRNIEGFVQTFLLMKSLSSFKIVSETNILSVSKLNLIPKVTVDLPEFLLCIQEVLVLYFASEFGYRD